MVRGRRKRASKKLIIEAAADLFSRKGFSGTRIDEIAERAGIGKGTIYDYFKSKEDLFFAVFEWFTGKIGEAATVNISALGGAASERLMALNDSLVGSWGDIRDMFSLFFEFWAASASSNMQDRFKESFRRIYGDFRNIVSSLIVEGIAMGEFSADVDPDSIAAALVGTWDCLFLQAWFDDEFDLVKTARNFLAVVINGMAVRK